MSRPRPPGKPPAKRPATDRPSPAGGTSAPRSRDRQADPSEAAGDSVLERYVRESESPLASLIFVFPWVIVYEVGVRWFVGGAGFTGGLKIAAYAQLHHVFSTLGATAAWLPAAALCAILATQAALSRNRPVLHLGVQAGMAVECFLLAVPLLALAQVSQQSWLWSVESWAPPALLAVGAGLYEELLFRLILLTGLHWLLADVLRMPKHWAFTLVVPATAALFASYHYWGQESVDVPSFVFRFAAGVYFGFTFCLRGFGITAGTHIVYDAVLLLMRPTAASTV